MKIKLIQFTFLLFIFSFVVHAQTNSWTGLVPLHSAKSDVEKIICQPEPDSKVDYAVFYKTKNERVFVLYSTGDCHIQPSNGWNIEKGKVIRLRVTPFIKGKFAEYKFDKSKYKESPEGDYEDLINYTNSEDGVMFTVNKRTGEIENFDYFPKLKDRSLMCK